MNMKKFNTRIAKYFTGLISIIWAISCIAADLTKHLPADITFKSNVSITSFPYDLTHTAVKNVSELVSLSGNVYTVQLDNGIPWQAALDDKPFSDSIQNEWRQHLNAISPAQKIYLAIAPLQDDRISWATEFEGRDAPNWVRNENSLNEKITKAYTNYINRAIDYFNPDFINIGVEAGDLAAKDPGKWTAIEMLFNLTIKSIKEVDFDLPVGISWGLPLLLREDVLLRSSALIENLDYVGISFYPYMGQFYEKIGGIELPQPPDQWRLPFDWLQANIKKPVAICETAYSSHDVELPEYQLNMPSSSKLQIQYIEELANTASKYDYLFTVFFLSVDYDVLMDKLGIPEMALWRNTGFFNADLTPKPAWEAYQKYWLDAVPDNSAEKLPEVKLPGTLNSGLRHKQIIDDKVIYSIVFDSEEQLFESEDKVKLGSSNIMQWTYKIKPDDWAWALKSINPGSLKGSKSIVLRIRSDQPGNIYLQLKESSGEGFYKLLHIDKSWKVVELPLESFELDRHTSKNNKLNMEDVENIMFADDAGKPGCCVDNRLIEVSEILFKK